jgi:dienelactone hydrolase
MNVIIPLALFLCLVDSSNALLSARAGTRSVKKKFGTTITTLHSQSSSLSAAMNWTPLEPTSYRHQGSSEEGPRFYKDDNYLQAVLELWESEDRAIPTETSPLVYGSSNEENTQLLYGHIIRRRRRRNPKDKDQKVPGILLFHTGAGPQDVFLLYKADMLAQALDCVVMICDILSDESGWAWGTDRTQYNQVRDALISKDDASLLESRVVAAGRALLCETTTIIPNVDSDRIAAMGWCLGGQPILELGRSHQSFPPLRAMITFHGVFRRDAPVVSSLSNKKTTGLRNEPSSSPKEVTEVLICNGAKDPFVSQEDLDDVKKLFLERNCKVEILQLAGAKHAFTNPAQAWNENPAFDYNQLASEKAWSATIELLERTIA